MAERGFSLIETLVALAVFSTAALALLALSTQSVAFGNALDQRFLARTVAENQMVDAVTTAPSDVIGVRSGEVTQMGKPFVWTETVEATERGGLVQITINVTRPGETEVLGRVTTLKRVAP